MRKIINTTKAPSPVGPYSQAIEAGNILYVSGQIPLNPQTGKLVQETIEQETDQVLQNLKAVIEAAGYELQNVVKCTIFLSDMATFSKVNQVYSTYFGEAKPARETVAVKALPLGANVEISAIAHKY